MTTQALIEELLGPNWWEREHDQTALCAVLDRVRENLKEGETVWELVTDAAWEMVKDKLSREQYEIWMEWVQQVNKVFASAYIDPWSY